MQRILQEAWEGAYTLRQEAEREVNELREAVAEEVNELRDVASREAADVVDQVTRRALAIRDETERRRHAYLQRIEQDRERAVSQITYLYDQRQDAIAELSRLQTTVQAVVEECAQSFGPPGAGRGRSSRDTAGQRRQPGTSGGGREQRAARSRIGGGAGAGIGGCAADGRGLPVPRSGAVVRAFIRKVPARTSRPRRRTKRATRRGKCDRGTAGGLGPPNCRATFDHRQAIRPSVLCGRP